MVLRQHGFPAVCFNGEGYGLNKESGTFQFVKSTVRSLKKRFTAVVLLLDSDDAGIRSAIKFSALHNVPFTYFNRAKDPSDFQMKFSPNKTHTQIKKLLAKLFKHEN